MNKIPQHWITPIRIVCVIAFNVYAWYWLIKIIWFIPFDWENLLSWVMACCGMWFFVIDTQDLRFKKEMNKSKSYPELLKSDEK